MMMRFRRLRTSEEGKISDALRKAKPAVERALKVGRKALTITIAAATLQACGDGKEIQIVPVPGGRVEIYSQSLEVARRICPQEIKNAPGVVDARRINDNSLTTSNNPAGISPMRNKSLVWVVTLEHPQNANEVTTASVDTIFDGKRRRNDTLVSVKSTLNKKKDCEEILTKAKILGEELGEDHWRAQQAQVDGDVCVEELNSMQFETNFIGPNAVPESLIFCEADGDSATFASSATLEEVPVEAR